VGGKILSGRFFGGKKILCRIFDLMGPLFSTLLPAKWLVVG
jgi:hypothetical protein